MKQSTTLILLAVLVSQAYAAPQLITFNDGKLGVNWGYHAAVGLGGLFGNNGSAGGGLFAEAGTPYGQAAKAGLGGAVDSKGGSGGSLYAGATAGGNVKAEAGLSGGVDADKRAGIGFASAQSGNNVVMSGLGGDSSANGGSGYTFSGTKTFGIPSGVISQSDLSVQPIEITKPVHKKVHKEFNFDAANEVNFVPLNVEQANTKTNVEVKTDVRPEVAVKEVSVQTPPQVVEKHVVHAHYKPRHHFRKITYVGQPAIEKRIDVGVEGAADAGVSADAAVNGGAGTQGVYTKQVTFQRNPNFFADIFNIPISTLKAVGSFLTNTAGSTNISVQKAESDSNSSKHDSDLSSSSPDTAILVQTPNVSQVIDDILAVS
ncbi:LOW QUALITY PROTEIN: uncharacterized protein ACR2FA_000858 [Aphomia sociella]